MNNIDFKIRNPFDNSQESHRPRFVGRSKNELALLNECRIRAERGRGGIFLLEGLAGVGKSRLLAEFSEQHRGNSLFISMRMTGYSEFVDFFEHLTDLLLGQVNGIVKSHRNHTARDAFADSTMQVATSLLIEPEMGRNPSPATTALLGTAIYGLNYLSQRLKNSRATGFSAPSRRQDLFKSFQQINQTLISDDRAMVLIFDQWEDLVKLDKDSRADFAGFLRDLHESLSRLDRCNILVLIGGRSGAIDEAIRGLILSKISVNEVPREDVISLLEHPWGDRDVNGPRFSHAGAEALLETLRPESDGDAVLSFALLQLAAKICCDQALADNVEIIEPRLIQKNIEAALRQQLLWFSVDIQDATSFLWALCRVHYASFSINDIERHLPPYGQAKHDVAKWLREFARQTGLIRQIPNVLGQYFGFSHQAHQSLLQSVTDGDESRRIWWDVITATKIAIKLKNPGGIPSSIRELPGTMIVESSLLDLAPNDSQAETTAIIRVWLLIAPVLHEMGHESWFKIVEQIIGCLDRDEVELRLEAAKAACELPVSGFISELISSLEDEAPEVRRYVALAIASCSPSDQAVLALLKAVINEEDDDARQGIASAIEELGVRKVAEVLQTSLHDIRPGDLSEKQYRVAATILFVGLGSNLSMPERQWVAGYLNGKLGAFNLLDEELFEKLLETNKANSLCGLLQSLFWPTRYEMVELLSKHSTGNLYKAIDRLLNRAVIFKRVDGDLDSEFDEERVTNEAQLLASLAHKNVAYVHDVGREPGFRYIVYRYFEGPSLADLLLKKGPLSERQAVLICREVANALEYLHSQRIIHRNVKPGSIFLSKSEKIILANFSVARRLDDARLMWPAGTAGYMSPEYILNEEIDARADVYALGITLYETVTGHLPFVKGDIGYHTIETPAPDPREFGAKVSEEFSKVCLRCLEKDKHKRFEDMTTLARQLEGLVQ